MNLHLNAMDVISSMYSISVDVLQSERRLADVVKCRCLIILIMREVYNLRFKEISELMNRNTSTVIRAYHNMDNKLRGDTKLYKEYYKIYELLEKRGLIS